MTISATPISGADNPLTDLVLTRGGEPARPVDRSVTESWGGQPTYTMAVFAQGLEANVGLVEVRPGACGRVTRPDSLGGSISS